jgi:hypothetical protein
MAEGGREPGPTVDEKGPFAARDAGVVDRDVVDDAYELPRVCALVVGCRVTEPGLFVSGFAVLGRVASGVVSSCRNMGSMSSIRDMLIALLAIDPGGMMPEREFVVAELASRSPCGMRVRVDALV